MPVVNANAKEEVSVAVVQSRAVVTLQQKTAPLQQKLHHTLTAQVHSPVAASDADAAISCVAHRNASCPFSEATASCNLCGEKMLHKSTQVSLHVYRWVYVYIYRYTYIYTYIYIGIYLHIRIYIYI